MPNKNIAPVTRTANRPITSLAEIDPQSIGTIQDRPQPEIKAYINISERENFKEGFFNTQKHQITRNVEISGVKLIWDRRDDNYGLMAFQGTASLDIQNLTMYADEVIIKSPLKFQRTNVKIFARHLIVEKDGSIDTSPRAFDQKTAYAKNRDAEGRPLGGNGQPKGASGYDGEPAGNIELFVKEVKEDKSGPIRFICKGSDGQDGEEGGLKAYQVKNDHKPDQGSQSYKDLTPVTIKDIETAIVNSGFLIEGERKEVWNQLKKIPIKGSVGPKNLEATIKTGTVSTIAITVEVGSDIRQFMFNGNGRSHEEFLKGIWLWEDLDNAESSRIKKFGNWPGDGEDAYPSGSGGNGGNGGNVIVHFSDSKPSFNAQKCDLNFGKGGKSESIEGGKAGTPQKSYWITCRTGYHAHHMGLKSSGSIKSSWQTQNGKSAPGKPGTDGKAGNYQTVKATSSHYWVHPTSLRAVITYAKDAFRAGYRQEAQDILMPYYEVLEDKVNTLGLELITCRTTISSMKKNLENNLDYYGNVVGWVPRLNVTTNFRLFEDERLNSAQLLYFATTAENNWSALYAAKEFAEATSDALTVELEVVQSQLEASFANLGNARDTLVDINKELLKLEGQYNSVQAQMQEKAKEHVELEQIWKGCLKLVGGLMKVIPVGQPFLGLGGGAIDTISDMDFTDETGSFTWDNLAKEIGGMSENIGGQVNQFMKDNKDYFVKGSSKDLRDNIKATQKHIRSIDTQVFENNQQLEKEWNKLQKEMLKDVTREIDRNKGRLRELEAKIKQINEQISKLEQNKDDKSIRNAKAKKEERKALESELQANQKSLTLLEDFLAKSASNNKVIPTQQAIIKLMMQLDENKFLDQKAKQSIKTSKDNIDLLLEKRKAEDEKVNLEQDVKDQEEKTTALLKQFQGLGDGIAKMGEGISYFAKVDMDHPKIKALLENFEDSPIFTQQLKDEYRNLLEKITQINQEKSVAFTKLLTLQQIISDSCAHISTSLTDLVTLSRERQNLDQVLTLDTQRYLQNMQQRAKDRLQESLYEFIKAYQYQQLMDVGKDFYKFDKWVEELQKVAQAKAQQGGSEGLLTEADFKEVENRILQDEYRDLLRQIVRSRQKYSSGQRNKYECELTSDQRRRLSEKGYITFNLVNDLKKGSFNLTNARIIDIELDTFEIVDNGQPDLSLDVDFIHSGNSILRDHAGNYWGFQRGKDDDPISWKYVYNHRSNKSTKDAPIYTDQELINMLKDASTDSASSTEISLQEYWPSFFSDITLWINKDHAGNPVDGIKEIREIKFTVHFTH